MNALIVKLFVFLTEIVWGIVIALLVLTGFVVAVGYHNVAAGIGIALGGTVLVVVLFGFAAIFIEIHKDLRAVRQLLERPPSAERLDR